MASLPMFRGLVRHATVTSSSMLAAALLAACGTATPECGSNDTVALVKQVFWEQIENQPKFTTADSRWFEKLKKLAAVKVSSIRTTGTDEKLGRISCEGTLEVQMPPGLQNEMRIYAMTQKVKWKDDSLSAEIEYRSQLTDDRKEQMVEVAGHTPLGNVIGDIARSGAFARAAAVAVQGGSTSGQPASSSTPPAASAKAASVGAAVPQRSRVERNATLIWLECGDMCHLQYKTAGGEVKSALCTEAAICRQWIDDPTSFKKQVGSRAALTLASQFVQEAGESMDSVVALEWMP